MSWSREANARGIRVPMHIQSVGRGMSIYRNWHVANQRQSNTVALNSCWPLYITVRLKWQTNTMPCNTWRPYLRSRAGQSLPNTTQQSHCSSCSKSGTRPMIGIEAHLKRPSSVTGEYNKLLFPPFPIVYSNCVTNRLPRCDQMRQHVFATRFLLQDFSKFLASWNLNLKPPSWRGLLLQYNVFAHAALQA